MKINHTNTVTQREKWCKETSFFQYKVHADIPYDFCVSYIGICDGAVAGMPTEVKVGLYLNWLDLGEKVT